MLEKEGWRVLAAANGQEALELFQKEKIDIVLTDIKMPCKDGLTALKEMREISDDFEALILSGFGDEANAIAAMRSGAYNFIRKPIDLEQLLAVLEKTVEKLNLNRILKYRNRELELKKEIIALFSKKQDLIVNIKNLFKPDNREFIANFFNAIPMGLMVINQDLEILYANNELQKIFDNPPEILDQTFLEKLEKIGISGLSFQSLKDTVVRVFQSGSGNIETISISKYAYITLTVIKTVSISEEEEKVVEENDMVILLAFRGERP
ncbi:response regulator [Fibrobacterota bacterium]